MTDLTTSGKENLKNEKGSLKRHAKRLSQGFKTSLDLTPHSTILNDDSVEFIHDIF